MSISGRRIAYLPTGELGKSLTQLKELLTLTVQLLYSGKLHAIQAHEPCNGPLKAKTFILRRKGLNWEHSRASHSQILARTYKTTGVAKLPKEEIGKKTRKRKTSHNPQVRPATPSNGKRSSHTFQPQEQGSSFKRPLFHGRPLF